MPVAKQKAVGGSSVWVELSKRRVFLFFSAFLFLSMIGDAFAEADKLSHAADEIAIVVLALIALAFIARSWNKRSLPELLSQNNVLTALVVLMIIAKIYGIIAEQRTDDFGNEIPVLIGLIILLANRFVQLA